MVKGPKIIVNKATTLGAILSIGLIGTFAEAGKDTPLPSPPATTSASGDRDGETEMGADWVEIVRTDTAKNETDRKRLETLPPGSPQAHQIQRNIEQRGDKAEGYAERAPTNVPLLNAAADQALGNGDIARAQGRADQAVSAAAAETDPKKYAEKWPAAMNMRAKVAMAAEDYPAAHAYAAEVRKKFPNDPIAQALFHETKGRVKAGAANRTPEEKPLRTPGPPPVPNPYKDPGLNEYADRVARVRNLNSLATSRLMMRDGNEAKRLALEAQALEPGIGRGYLLEARAWGILGDLAQALDRMGRAIELLTKEGGNPLADAYTDRAKIHNALKNRGAAVKDADAALQINPNSAQAHRQRGAALQALGQIEAAKAALRRAAELDGGGSDGGDYYGQSEQAAPAQDRKSALHQAWTKLPGKAGGSFALVMGTMGALSFLIAGGFLWFAKEDSAAGRFKTRWFTPSGGAETAGRNGQDDVIGKTVGGHILIQSVRDRGGMGLVFNGLDTKLERSVAVKRLLPELQGDKASCARMLDEARTLAKFHHPNIVEIFEVIDDGDGIFIICPLIDGRTVHAEFDDSDGRRLPPARILEILVPVGDAITYAHGKHVIHRDIKPSNIMTTAGGRVMVMDFGIARSNVPHSHVTAVNTIVGTPAYMAPEQATGNVCRQSDVFALGVTVYQLATGRLPFGMNDLLLKLERRPGRFPAPSSLVPSLPTEFDAAIEKALDADPLKRQKSCSELAQEVAAAFQQKTPPLA